MINNYLTQAGCAYESTPGSVDGISVTALKTMTSYERTWQATARSTASSSINWIGISYWTVEQMRRDFTYSYWS